jgi:hypothetical protein
MVTDVFQPHQQGQHRSLASEPSTPPSSLARSATACAGSRLWTRAARSSRALPPRAASQWVECASLPAALPPCAFKHLIDLLSRQAHAAAATSRPVCMADALKSGVLAEMRSVFCVAALLSKAISSLVNLISRLDKVYMDFGHAELLLRLEDVEFAHQIDHNLYRTLITL